MAVTWSAFPAVGLPIWLFLTCKPAATVAAEPLIETARAAVTTLLFSTIRFAAVAPAATPVTTEVIAVGAVVASEAFGPKKMPNVVFSDAVVLVAVAIFLPGELPTIFRFLNMLLSALLTVVMFNATRITDVNVIVLAAVF